ncbi:MAG: site-2 protease family protein [Gammaproteobacteria bacterium]
MPDITYNSRILMHIFSIIQQILIYAIPIVFAITVHEVAHGWVASKLGDQTARMMGRLTLNPVKHIDPVGTLVVPLILLTITNFIFGWAKPVPVDWRNLRNPKRDMAYVAIAGPFANLLMLTLWALLAKLIFISGDMYHNIAPQLFEMCRAGIFINIILMVLNLFPVPPLDGSRVLSALLPPVWAYRFNRVERYGLVILLVLLATGLLGRALGPLVFGLDNYVTSLITV